MKIDINRIPQEGLILEENIPVSDLGLGQDTVKYHGPIYARAEVSRITNAVSVDMFISVRGSMECSRCLNEVQVDFKKDLKLNYPANRMEPVIDLNQDIREEIILGYPFKPLCKTDCKGLCIKCGRNLNEGSCNCVY